FPHAGALALLPEGDRLEARDRWLPWLVQQEILVPRAAAGDDLHAFRHALLREGAYAMLTGRDRVLGHRLAGAVLAQVADADPRGGGGRRPPRPGGRARSSPGGGGGGRPPAFPRAPAPPPPAPPPPGGPAATTTGRSKRSATCPTATRSAAAASTP